MNLHISTFQTNHFTVLHGIKYSQCSNTHLLKFICMFMVYVAIESFEFFIKGFITCHAIHLQWQIPFKLASLKPGQRS